MLNLPCTRSRNRPNGAHTFRRASANTTSQTRDTTQPTPTSATTGVYIPPHLNSSHPSHAYRNGLSTDTRYSREQLLDLFQSQKEAGGLSRNLADLFQGSWDPMMDKDTLASQGLKGDGKDQYPGPEVCWNPNAEPAPFGLVSMSEEEKEVHDRCESPQSII